MKKHYNYYKKDNKQNTKKEVDLKTKAMKRKGGKI